MGFQTGPEDSHGKFGSDVLRQTVPDTSSSDWESSVPNGRQSSAKCQNFYMVIIKHAAACSIGL